MNLLKTSICNNKFSSDINKGCTAHECHTINFILDWKILRYKVNEDYVFKYYYSMFFTFNNDVKIEMYVPSILVPTCWS